jgi:multicomponent Na+:H+ antiporter subunit D
MTDNNIILPVITHLFTAVVLIFLWQRTRLSRYISVIGNLMLVGESFMLFYRTQVVGYS